MDLIRRRIPNLLIILGYAGGFYYCLDTLGTGGIGFFLFRGLWPIVLFYLMFLMGALGAGDIKLFSVLSVFYPAGVTFSIIGISILTAAVFGLLRILLDGTFLYRIQNLKTYAGAFLSGSGQLSYKTLERDSSYLHFAVFIFCGYFITVVKEGILWG